MRDRGDNASLIRLIDRLRDQGTEKSWIEYKVNNSNPDEVGEYISALANSAALDRQRRGYLVWGIEDTTLKPVGTKFRPAMDKVGNEELPHWLVRLLSPQVFFEFKTVTYDNLTLVILQVEPASASPVQFKNVPYIRIGSIKKKLKDHAAHEQRLWQTLNAHLYEENVALDHLTVGDVVELIDYPTYFKLTNTPLPETRGQIIEALAAAQLITWDVGSEWSILNLGGLLFANDLNQFSSLAGKATRVITYEGNSRVRTKREQLGRHGYARGFAGLMQYITGWLPDKEVIGAAYRTQHPLYPELAA